MRRILFTFLGLALALPAAAAPDGAQLFVQNCAACHGADAVSFTNLRAPETKGKFVIRLLL